MLYGHDIFLALDAGWRVLNGQRPDVDFSPSLSPALGMLFAVALRLAHNSVNAVGYASALVGAAAGLLSYWLVRRRLPGMPAVLAAIVLTLIAVAPFPVGLPPNSLSQAMLYNRYGYALLGLVLLEAFQGSRDGRRADAAGGGFLTGVVIIALLFLKPSYCLVAVAFVICSSVLARHDARRYLGILLGLLACGVAMMAYLRLDFAAVWKDLHLMSQARSAGLSMWTIRWSLINAVTDFLPLAVLAVLIKSWKTIAISMVVFTGGALLLATNGQLRGFPLNAVLAILLIERGRAALKTDAVPILIGLIAYLPFCFGSAGGLGYALFQSRRIPPHSEVARFQPPHLAGLLLYDMPDGTDADRRSNGPTYVTYVNDGVNLLNRASRMDETVFTLDVQNPFSYALLRRPAHGGSAALYFDHTFNDQHKPSAAWLFGSADIVNGAGDARGDQRARGLGRAGEQIEQGRRGPAPDREPDQRRMGRLAQRHAVQRVGGAAAAQGLADHPAEGGGRVVEGGGVLDPLGQFDRVGERVPKPLARAGVAGDGGVIGAGWGAGAAHRENGRGREGLTYLSYPASWVAYPLTGCDWCSARCGAGIGYPPVTQGAAAPIMTVWRCRPLGGVMDPNGPAVTHPVRRSRINAGDVRLAMERGDPASPTVVLVHGYPDTSGVWDELAERRAGRFHVVAYDVRGAGASTAPGSTEGYAFARLIADLETVITEVSPDRPVHLVGHDWGSLQCWEAVSTPRLAGRVASFTSMCGPSVGTRPPRGCGAGPAAARAARSTWPVSWPSPGTSGSSRFRCCPSWPGGAAWPPLGQDARGQRRRPARSPRPTRSPRTR